jgi:predicted enzyme related to lactoylglutathione lyase
MASTILGARPVLGCRDLDATTRFWTHTLGFAVLVQRDRYVLLRAGEAEIALQAADRPAPAEVVLLVTGVAELHAACVGAGIPVVVPLQTRESGRRDFTVEDPNGHRVGLAEMPSRAGRVGRIDLTVEDATDACDFWAAVVGFDGVEAVPRGGWSDFALTRDGREVAGVCHRRGVNANAPAGVWIITFVVDDLERSLEVVTRRGGAGHRASPPPGHGPAPPGAGAPQGAG